MIKKRIESLIEREYLERDKDQKNKYIYKPWNNYINPAINEILRSTNVFIIIFHKFGAQIRFIFSH